MSETTVTQTARKRGSCRQSLLSFRELTRGYFGSERLWEFAVELLLFSVIVAISVWPILTAASALGEFLSRTAA
jgi:hypothetical protein